jgi:hypothetical protein
MNTISSEESSLRQTDQDGDQRFLPPVLLEANVNAGSILSGTLPRVSNDRSHPLIWAENEKIPYYLKVSIENICFSAI